MIALIDTRSEYDSLASLYLPIAIVVAVLVWGAMAFAVVRYRRREGREPSRRSEHTRVELAYAAVLAAIVVVLVASSFSTEERVDAVSPDPGLEVDVRAFQWGWRFTYPGSGVSVVGDDRRPPTLTVPTDTTIRFSLTSRDVIHAFWVPELRFKRDAIPDRSTVFDLVFDRDAIGRCAEYCGLAHAEMTFSVVTMSPRRFEQWLRERSGG